MKKPQPRDRVMMNLTVDPEFKLELDAASKELRVSKSRLIEMAWKHYEIVLAARRSAIKAELDKDLR
jgi:hypothetical protein